MPYFTQPISPDTRPEEICTMEVAGTYFSDWETVWIHNTWQDPNAEFRFTCAERDQTPIWDKVQFKPRDFCKIWLANIKAIEGVIIVRQVAYDANSHGVSLQGVGRSWYAARASILTTQNVNYDGPLVDIARKVLAPTGVKLATIGNIDATPFNDPPVHPQPGETIFSFIERLAKDRNTIIGSTEDGAFLLIGDHAASEEADLLEGFNIKSAQVVIDDRYARDNYWAIGQSQASDRQNMTKSGEVLKGVPGDLPFYSPLLVPLEHPVHTPEEVLLRAKHEQTWGMGEEITANITVNGWFNPRDKRLWRPGMAVHVKSPMAMLDMKLGIRSVTFTQDRQSGSQTTLDLVRPYRLKMYDDSPGSPSSKEANPTQSSSPLPPVI
jgi:prophage tail gpP-like protein